MNNATVCSDLKKMKADLRQLVVNSRNMGNMSQVRDLTKRINELSSTMDQFCVVLERPDARIIPSGLTSDCFLHYKPCRNDDKLCVYASPQMDPQVRSDACATNHIPGDVFMIAADEAFPGRSISPDKFPVAYAKRDDLNSPRAVSEYLKRHLRQTDLTSPDPRSRDPGESITPRIVPVGSMARRTD
jgi:hypothetical protein